jgi:hypothetical protein
MIEEAGGGRWDWLFFCTNEDPMDIKATKLTPAAITIKMRPGRKPEALERRSAAASTILGTRRDRSVAGRQSSLDMVYSAKIEENSGGYQKFK